MNTKSELTNIFDMSTNRTFDKFVDSAKAAAEVNPILFTLLGFPNSGKSYVMDLLRGYFAGTSYAELTLSKDGIKPAIMGNLLVREKGSKEVFSGEEFRIIETVLMQNILKALNSNNIVLVEFPAITSLMIGGTEVGLNFGYRLLANIIARTELMAAITYTDFHAVVVPSEFVRFELPNYREEMSSAKDVISGQKIAEKYGLKPPQTEKDVRRAGTGATKEQTEAIWAIFDQNIDAINSNNEDAVIPKSEFSRELYLYAHFILRQLSASEERSFYLYNDPKRD